ncbi:MAG: thioredoxin family protein [Burkholderiales bacterium]|nr:thioredoxin family protein [Burkholderiales bacterium]
MRRWLMRCVLSRGAQRGVAALGTLALSTCVLGIKTDHVEVDLVAEKAALTVGSQWIGIRVRHQPGWHTYWTNPGDAGYAMRLSWTLPSGVTASDIRWPAPRRIPTGDSASPAINFGYKGDTLLPVVLQVEPSALAAAGDKPIKIGLHAEWLVCRDICVPEEGDITLALSPTRGGDAVPDATHAPLFAAARARLPEAKPAWKAVASVDGARLQLNVTLPPGERVPASFEVFPVAEGVLDPTVHKTFRTADGISSQLKLMDGKRPDAPLQFVVVGATADGKPVVASVQAALGAAGLSPTAQSLVDAKGKSDMSAWSAIALAFLGGLILNLMPCVFPVLSLKILGFAQHAGQGEEGRSALRAHGTAYAVGVLVSFLLLAAVLLGLRQGGAAVGWGFHLQSPVVVWVLAVVFCLIALNLAGLFEFGQFAPSSVLSFQAKNPLFDAFVSGVIAVVAASPCSAPFMGAALGFAVAQSNFTALAVFAALGVGMALPYVLLASFPAWIERLPRPGLWMVQLKQALAFPMFATVVWLIWVLAQQGGLDTAVIGLFALVVLSLGAWLAGIGRRFSAAVGLATGLLAVAAGWPAAAVNTAVAARSASTGPNGPVVATTAAGKEVWQAWTPERVKELLTEGKPVFVDFTAAWCVSCQANKRLVLARTDIASEFAGKEVVLLRADWTNRDERITRVLNELGRTGVPAYALYAPGRPVQLLPELLTTAAVRDAISTL